jgi:nitrogenase molybdenum-iron protein alpha/beta subunit
MGDEVQAVAAQAQEELGVRIIAIRSEGFSGDFRSGHEDAFKVIMKLMDPPRPGERLKGTINLVGARGVLPLPSARRTSRSWSGSAT